LTKTRRGFRFSVSTISFAIGIRRLLWNPYANKKKAVGINLSPQVVDYFKELAGETGLPYQKLIDLYLLDCAKRRRKLSLKWVA